MLKSRHAAPHADPFVRWLLFASLLAFAAGCSSEPPEEPGVWAAAAPAEIPIPEELTDICHAGPRTHPRDTLAPPAPAPAGPNVRAIPAESPDQLQLSGSSEGPFRCVVRSEAEWHAIWSSQGPDGIPPAVDFDRYTVLVATMGGQGSTGYEIRMDTIVTTGDSVTAIVWQYFPPLGAMVGELLTSPAHVVQIPRTDLPVRFLERIGENPRILALLGDVPGTGMTDTMLKASWVGLDNQSVVTAEFDFFRIYDPMGKAPVPAVAPDSVPDWVYADENIISNSPLMPGKFLRNIVIIGFQMDATQAERQAAVDAINGTVIGGRRWYRTDGDYYVQIQDDGTARPLFEALETLNALPQVDLAYRELIDVDGPA